VWIKQVTGDRIIPRTRATCGAEELQDLQEIQEMRGFRSRGASGASGDEGQGRVNN
jgi:hypothetical protein